MIKQKDEIKVETDHQNKVKQDLELQLEKKEADLDKALATINELDKALK